MNVANTGKNNTLQVMVRGPEGILFQGAASAISSVNNSGPFDILPYHANFISLIRDRVQIIKPDKTVTTLPLQRGIIKNFENTVDIFLGIETVS